MYTCTYIHMLICMYKRLGVPRYVLQIQVITYTCVYIRESVDSLCRDDADMPRPPYI